jgi:IS5 family transposase
MLRIYFLQQWYGLSDPGMEEALYDIESVRRFAGIELGEEEIPDETTILNFRHLLEKYGLTEKLLAEVNGYLSEKKLWLREGTIVDATLISAPCSTKNKDKKRDGEMSLSSFFSVRQNRWNK